MSTAILRGSPAIKTVCFCIVASRTTLLINLAKDAVFVEGGDYHGLAAVDPASVARVCKVVPCCELAVETHVILALLNTAHLKLSSGKTLLLFPIPTNRLTD